MVGGSKGEESSGVKESRGGRDGRGSKGSRGPFDGCIPKTLVASFL